MSRPLPFNQHLLTQGQQAQASHDAQRSAAVAAGAVAAVQHRHADQEEDMQRAGRYHLRQDADVHEQAQRARQRGGRQAGGHGGLPARVHTRQRVGQQESATQGHQHPGARQQAAEAGGDDAWGRAEGVWRSKFWGGGCGGPRRQSKERRCGSREGHPRSSLTGPFACLCPGVFPRPARQARKALMTSSSLLLSSFVRPHIHILG